MLVALTLYPVAKFGLSFLFLLDYTDCSI